MTNSVSRAAASTLADVGAALRRNEDLTWEDPEFLKWEREQVSDRPPDRFGPDDDGLARVVYRRGASTEHTGNTIRPMVAFMADDDGWGKPGHVCADDYPAPEETSYGPLMLGPEPDEVIPTDAAGTLFDRAMEFQRNTLREWQGQRVTLGISDETQHWYAVTDMQARIRQMQLTLYSSAASAGLPVHFIAGSAP